MEYMTMRCRLVDEQLTITWFVENSLEWGGNDFIKTFTFDEVNMEKLFAALGVCGAKDGEVKACIEARFGHNVYNTGLAEFCEEHDVHYAWREYVDYPGFYAEEGRK